MNKLLLNKQKIFNRTNDLSKYTETIKNYKLVQFNNESKNVAVLLESRIFDNTEFILRQFSRFLPEDFAMWIYVTQNVYDQYVELGNKLNNGIRIILLPEEFKLTSIDDYNNIMLNISFWNLLIQFERVLIFQMDTMIYRNGIEQFYKYDYIGAPWDPKFKICETNVGNGGLSLRNIKAVIDCLKNRKKILEPSEKIPEDIFYSKMMFELGYNVPEEEVASLFAIEDYLHNEKCFGSHKLDKFHINLFNKILGYIFIYHNIFWFEISMNNILVMQIF
jgi:hypothetical protein